MPITFSREDHWVHLPEPGSYPLVVAPTIDRVLLSKLLIDGDSSRNIIFIETLKCMDFNFERLLPCEDPFYGIVPGKGSYPIGRVILPVKFGTQDNYRTKHLTFEVANFKTSYHAILGKLMLAGFMAIPNHTYLVLKMPAPYGILSVYDDVETSYKCDTEAVQLANTLEYMTNATIMLAESKKLDQNQLAIPEADPMPMALQPNPWALQPTHKSRRYCPKDPFPLSRIDQVVDSTITLNPADQDRTAFITPFRIYCYNTLNFGLKNAITTYQKAIQGCLVEQLHKNVEAYVDDVVAKTKDEENFIADLALTFNSLWAY
ncbi:uncharacterized protein [Setaria viridis]|uniref:uncharacterized protein n=1 Tax=Setaria viridis TaxID=4556 RepID=UPI003B3BE26D